VSLRIAACLLVVQTLWLSTSADTARAQGAASAQAMAEQAGAALEAGRFAEAAALFEKLAAQYPSEAGLQLNHGMALAMSGQPDRALAPLQRALKLDPSLLPANLFLGIVHLELAEPAKALPSLQRVIAMDADNAYARQALGQALIALQRFDEAADQFEALSRVQPDAPQIWAALGQAYEEVARAAFSALQEQDPDSPHVWLLVADVLAVQEKYPQAFDLMRKAQAALPGFPGIHQSIADIYAATGNAEWAAAERARAATTAPDCATLPVACAFLAEHYHEALRKTRGSRSAAALYWRARSANELAGRAFEALDNLPASIEQHLVRAGILRDQNRPVEAAAVLREALKLAPGDPSIERDLAGALFAARDAEAALPLLARLSGQAPDDLDLGLAYAEVLVQVSNPDPAIPLLRKALAARPDWVEAHGALGRALMQKGEAEAAVPHLQRALPLDQDGSLHYQLAQALQRTGQTAEAQAMLQKYQDLQQAVNSQGDDAEPTAPPAITPPAP
jgi:predicted Zn-dependent protease